MTDNWNEIYNRLWQVVNSPGDCYFSGPRFLNRLREVDLDTPPYGEFIEERRRAGQSTSRKDYFRDALMSLSEIARWRVVSLILEDVEDCAPAAAAEIRGLLGSPVHAPTASVPVNAWNANRLNEMLAEIDAAIGSNQYERAVTLAYTCLEGFYGAFFRAKAPNETPPTEIVALSRWIRDYLKSTIASYPDEVLNMLGHSTHAIDRARNRFSEAHFGAEAGRWLASYTRDLVNIQIRLLLHFL